MSNEKYEYTARVSKMSGDRYYVLVPKPYGALLKGTWVRVILEPISEPLAKRGV